MLGVFTSASTKLVLDHVEQQDRGLDKLQIATAAMDGADGDGEKTKKVLLPLIKASKCWSVETSSTLTTEKIGPLQRDVPSLGRLARS